jgi:hypothetical protein
VYIYNKPADISDFLDFSNAHVLISLEFLVCLKVVQLGHADLMNTIGKDDRYFLHICNS